MIAGIFHEGSGLGDQLFRYITVRTLAEEKGFDFGMTGSFKGDFFLEKPQRKMIVEMAYKKWNEKVVRDENDLDVRSYDPEINFIEDNTIIDGSFEDDKYWRHNLENINKWLAVEPIEILEELCIVGFRGGEYVLQPELFLPYEYYDSAIKKIQHTDRAVFKPRPSVRFQVHTDDTELAKQFFNSPDFEVVDNPRISHSKNANMGFNWRSARYAKYAIIPNSAFFIIPRILKHLEDPTAVTIAPRYWARRNTKTWARPACYYPEFTYL